MRRSTRLSTVEAKARRTRRTQQEDEAENLYHVFMEQERNLTNPGPPSAFPLGQAPGFITGIDIPEATNLPGMPGYDPKFGPFGPPDSAYLDFMHRQRGTDKYENRPFGNYYVDTRLGRQIIPLAFTDEEFDAYLQQKPFEEAVRGLSIEPPQQPTGSLFAGLSQDIVHDDLVEETLRQQEWEENTRKRLEAHHKGGLPGYLELLMDQWHSNIASRNPDITWAFNDYNRPPDEEQFIHPYM